MTEMKALEAWLQHRERNGDQVQERPEPTVSYLVVQRGERYLAIPFANVRRVTRLETFSPLPGAVPLLPGATNIEGHVVAVMDLAPLLGEEVLTPRPGLFLVLVADQNVEVGLLVTRAVDVHDVPHSALKTDGVPAYVQAFYGWPLQSPTYVVHVLDVAQVVEAALHAYD